jgi:DNA ligase (NAD+)
MGAILKGRKLFWTQKHSSKSLQRVFLFVPLQRNKMTTMTPKEEIEQLRRELEQHNYNYYILAKPTISDYEFDMKLEELAGLEKAFPEFLSPASPTQRVGGGVTKEFQSVQHRYPMLSLANSYSREEIAEFISRIKKTIDEEV